MPRTLIGSGQEIIGADLSGIPSRHEMEIYDRVIYELMRRQQNVAFGDSFQVSYINSTTVQVKAGNGFQLDNTQVDPEPQNRVLRVATNTNKTITGADPTNNRIDIVCIKANRANILTDTRNVKDVNTGSVAATLINVESDWASDLAVTAGTPSGSPAVPSTPAGYIKLAEVLVTAVTGVSGPSAITDKRPIFQPGSTSLAPTAVTTTYQAIASDEMLSCDMSGSSNASYTVTLPPAALMINRTIHWLVKAGTGTLTMKGNGSELLTNQNTQDYATVGTRGSAWSDGTQWWIN